MNKTFLYKDDYKRFLICPKVMWIMRHRRDKKVRNWVKNNLTFLDKTFEEMFNSYEKITENQPAKNGLEIRAISGMKFEKIIIDYLSKKKKILHFDHLNQKLTPQKKSDQTINLITNQTYQGYSQPYFLYQEYVTKCDLLLINQDNSYDLIEIKSVNNIENKRKKEYQHDLDYQAWILQKLNFKVKNNYILHLNKDYWHQTEKIDFSNFYSLTPFKQTESKTIRIKKDLQAAYDYLLQDFAQMKKILLGNWCEEKENKKMENCTYLIKKVTSQYNWLHLYQMRRTTKALLLAKNHNLEIDLKNRQDLTLIEKEMKKKGKKIQEKWQRIINVVNGKDQIIHNNLQTFRQLKKYFFPIYFYDFETSQFNIPKFKYTYPWAQIPFQYSIHVLLNDNYNLTTGANIVHLEFLVKNKQDPRDGFIKHFCQDIEKYGLGTYVAFHSSFEITILKNLLADKQMIITAKEATIIKKVIKKSKDLKDFFAQNFNIYHPAFYGSLSIKKVLPALVNDLSYRHLKVQKGDQASALYFNYIHKLVDQKIWQQLRKDLKKYCSLDTWAMVLIYEKIKNWVKKTD